MPWTGRLSPCPSHSARSRAAATAGLSTTSAFVSLAAPHAPCPPDASPSGVTRHPFGAIPASAGASLVLDSGGASQLRSHAPLVVAVMDVQNFAAFNGSSAILKPSQGKLMLRERWLLYVQCVESKVSARGPVVRSPIRHALSIRSTEPSLETRTCMDDMTERRFWPCAPMFVCVCRTSIINHRHSVCRNPPHDEPYRQFWQTALDLAGLNQRFATVSTSKGCSGR
jgi:hypothetical protein